MQNNVILKTDSYKKIGAVVLNYNSFNKTIECVNSILKTSDFVDLIVIIDNASINDSILKLNEQYNLNNNVVILSQVKNLGYAKGNNIGLQFLISKGYEYALITNNDVLYVENSIIILYSYIIKHPNVALIGPKIYNPEMKLQHSTRLNEPKFSELFGFLGKSIRLNESIQKESLKVYSISGSSMIVSIKNLMRVDLFDENTFLYNEENIMSFKLSKLGLTTIFSPESIVIHNHGYTTGRNNMFVNKEYIKSSFYYWLFYRKTSILFLSIFYIFFTLKWFIKGIFFKSMRKGWSEYFRETFLYFKSINIRLPDK